MLLFDPAFIVFSCMCSPFGWTPLRHHRFSEVTPKITHSLSCHRCISGHKRCNATLESTKYIEEASRKRQ